MVIPMVCGWPCQVDSLAWFHRTVKACWELLGSVLGRRSQDSPPNIGLVLRQSTVDMRIKTQGACASNVSCWGLMFVCSIPVSPSVCLSLHPPLYISLLPPSLLSLSHVSSLSPYPFPLNEASRYIKLHGAWSVLSNTQPLGNLCKHVLKFLSSCKIFMHSSCSKKKNKQTETYLKVNSFKDQASSRGWC